jgi:hypothetical protein
VRETSQVAVDQTQSRTTARGYVADRFKTDVRVLPQLGPLEGKTADTPSGRHETGSAQTPVCNIVEGRRPQGRVTRAVMPCQFSFWTNARSH